MSMEELKKQLKENHIGRLYLFTGPEQFLVRYYVHQMMEKLLDENTKALNYMVFEGKVSFQAVSDAVSLFPAFSPRRVVVVKESTLMKQGAKDLDWNGFFKSLPDYICLIFLQEEVDKRLTFYKAVKNHGLVVECNRQDEAALTRWVMKGFSNYKKQIDERDAAYLVALLEPDMTFMALEIDKIASYLGDSGRVTREAIDAITSKSVKSRIFDLTDAISQQQTAQALQILNGLMEQKEPLPYIMAMVGRQMAVLWRMKKMEAKGMSQADIARALGLHPYIAGKVHRQAASFTMEKLRSHMRRLLELDEASKTGRMDPRTALEMFIVETGRR